MQATKNPTASSEGESKPLSQGSESVSYPLTPVGEGNSQPLLQTSEGNSQPLTLLSEVSNKAFFSFVSINQLMTRYDKGSFFERQLKELLEKKGFYVVRAAGSGVAGWTPDLIVLRSTKKFALECKAWKDSLFIDKPTIKAFQEWERITGMPLIIAWKMPHKEWRFFPLGVMNETQRGYSLSSRELESGLTIDEITK